MELPAYTTEPGHPGSITDLIVDRVDNCATPNEIRRIRWTCSYQGETDFEPTFGRRERLHFRWGKCPWRWGFEREGTKYWNYANEDDFQREFNGSWGILHRTCGNPVNAETLEAFRKLYYPGAVTGYFDHVQRRWIVCEPTDQELATETWKQTPNYQEFCAHFGLKA